MRHHFDSAHLILLIPVAALLLLLQGCETFLSENPTGNMTTENIVIQNPSDVQAVVIGPYRSLPNWTSSATDWGNYLPATLEYPTGKATSEAVHPQLWRYQQNQVTGDLLNNFNNQWEYWYRGVRDANFAIQTLRNAENVAPDIINEGLGEVRTLRAWYYFNLVRYFGDVVMDTTGIGNLSEAQKPRTSIKTIYDEVILPDLEFAVHESGLPDGQSSEGRVTRDVARVILADVYLTVAGYPYQEIATDPEAEWSTSGLWSAQEYPVNSASALEFLRGAREQLDALYGTYELGTYGDLRNPAMNNQGEAIFQAQYQSGVTNNSVVPTTLPYNSQISMYGSEYGSFLPTVAYINSYSPDDRRLEDRQFFFYSDNLSQQYDTNEGPAAPFSRPYLFKYYDEEAIKGTSQSGLNWTFYRYADVLLMLSEVNWTLSALGESIPDEEITKGINEVRARAELAPYDVSEVNLHTIISERAYELIFENKMLWDQRRTRRALVDGNGSFARLEPLMGHQPTGFSFSFGAKNLLSPIPGREITTNGEMVQNYDYLPR